MNSFQNKSHSGIMGIAPFLLLTSVSADDDVILFVYFTNEAMAAHVSRYLSRDYRRLTWLNVAGA